MAAEIPEDIMAWTVRPLEKRIADLEALLDEAEKCIHSVYKPGYAVCPGSGAMDLIDDWLDRKRKLI